MASSFDPDASLFPLVTFRDVRDAIPQPRTVTYRQLAELVAPEQPAVRQDVVTQARKKIDLIDRFERLLRTKGHPDDWTVGNPTWRSLERAHWTGVDDAERAAALATKAEELRANALKRAKGSLPCWSPTVYRPGATRGSSGVQFVTCLVLDYDDGTPPDAALAPWLGWPLVAATTWSHRAEAPRFRVVLALEEPVPVSAWAGAWHWAAERSVGEIDPACKDPARMYLLPAVSSPAHPYFRIDHDPGGRLLRIDWESLPSRPAAPRPRGPGETTLARRVRPGRRIRARPGLGRRRARQMLNNDRTARERAATYLRAKVVNGRAEEIACPGCGRESTWFYLEPGRLTTASCDHKNSCGWFGFLDQLLDAHGGGDVG